MLSGPKGRSNTYLRTSFTVKYATARGRLNPLSRTGVATPLSPRTFFFRVSQTIAAKTPLWPSKRALSQQRGSARERGVAFCCQLQSETFRRSQPPVFFQKYCRTNGRRTAVQMGGVLQYKWEVYSWVSLSSRLRSQESTAIQMGGVLPYKLEVYCRTF